MEKLEKLKMAVESMGHDDGLRMMLLKGCNALPELTVSKALDDLECVRTSIPDLLRRTDALVSAVKQHSDGAQLTKVKTQRIRVVRALPTDNNVGPESPSSEDEALRTARVLSDSSSSAISDFGIFSPAEMWVRQMQTYNEMFLLGSQTVISAYINSVQALVHVVSVSYVPNSSSERQTSFADSNERMEQSSLAVAAVKQAISAAQSAFDNMARASAQFSAIHDVQIKADQVSMRLGRDTPPRLVLKKQGERS